MTRRLSRRDVERLFPTSIFDDRARFSLLQRERSRFLRETGCEPMLYQAPVTVQLELLSVCNLKCLHCYNMSKSHTCFPVSHDLNISDWLGVVDELGELGVFSVVISGGEPSLLGNSLTEIIHRLAEHDISVSLITNGEALSHAHIVALRDANSPWVQVSIDAYNAETHDLFRGKKGNWLKAVRSALKVSGAGLNLRIAHTVFPENVCGLIEMVDLAFLLGADTLIVGPITLSGRAILNHSRLQLNERQKEELDYSVRQALVEYHGMIEVALAMDSVETLRNLCDSPLSSVVIRPDGTVRIDCSAPFALGNIRERSLTDIWRSAGVSAASHPAVLEYVSKITKETDLLEVRPRPFVDPDIILSPGKQDRV